MSFRYILAVDGGGTKCRVRVQEATGQVLATRIGGSANIGAGSPLVMQEILRLVEDIRHAERLPESFYDDLAAGFGLAGVIDPADVASFVDMDSPFARLAVTSDAAIACLGAHDGHDGGVCILGTGSVACALQNATPRQIGGWGFQVGDQGSGAWLGRRALQVSLKAHDGLAEPSGLTQRIMTHFGDDPPTMVRWARGAQPADYGAFAPWVVEAAVAEAETDAQACRLMAEAAEAAEQMLAVLWAQGLTNLSLVGGFAPSLMPWLSSHWQQRLTPPRQEPIMGAVALALDPSLIQGSLVKERT